MSRQEDFIDAGIAYRMEHGKPMCIAGSNLADVERDFNRVLPFETGCEYGYQYALTHPQWIPVEEKLPEVDDCGNSDFYLVHDFGESDHVAYYCKTDNEWYTENGESVFSTHWMPIVPPRKEE